MMQQVALLIATLTEKKKVLGEVKALLEREQSCLSTLDLPGMESTQQALGDLLAQFERLSRGCRNQIATIAAVYRLPEPANLSQLVERLAGAEREALRAAQEGILADSHLLNRALELHRRLLQDSLAMVNHSVGFFNRLFNPVDTYGNAGALVSRRGGSRFVCKEI